MTAMRNCFSRKIEGTGPAEYDVKMSTTKGELWFT